MMFMNKKKTNNFQSIVRIADFLSRDIVVHINQIIILEDYYFPMLNCIDEENMRMVITLGQLKDNLNKAKSFTNSLTDLMKSVSDQIPYNFATVVPVLSTMTASVSFVSDFCANQTGVENINPEITTMDYSQFIFLTNQIRIIVDQLRQEKIFLQVQYEWAVQFARENGAEIGQIEQNVKSSQEMFSAHQQNNGES